MKKTIGLIALTCCEVVGSARILLFAIPVLLNSHFLAQQQVTANPASKAFFPLIALASFLFLCTGIITAISWSSWKIFHYTSSAVVVIATVYTIASLNQAGAAVPSYFFIPAGLSVITVGYVFNYKG